MSTASKLYLTVFALSLLPIACDNRNDPLSIDQVTTATAEGQRVAAKDGAADIIDPFRHRLETEFVVEGELTPGTLVTVRLEGIATEKITGGSVRILLPTLAAMEHAGVGARPSFPPEDEKFPTAASWTLPPMDSGAHWKRTIEVGPFEKGYYHIVALVDARGPNASPYLANDGYDQAWMYIIGDGGFLTPVFDIDVFPPEIAPLPGPFRVKGEGYGGTAQASADALGDSDDQNVYVRVLYVEDDNSAKAVGATIWANTISATDPDDDYPTRRETRTVGSSGIVQFTCPGATQKLVGAADLPSTPDIYGVGFNPYWDAFPGECGDTITVLGRRSTYLPWKYLGEAAELIEDHFGVNRSRVKWTVNLRLKASKYVAAEDSIKFNKTYDKAWVNAHEFTHALHHEKLGGLWHPGSTCEDHQILEPSNYKCALLEGIADYGGNIGAPTHRFYDWDTIHVAAPSGREEAEIEGNIAALFHDLIDGGSDESADKTHYSTSYVMTVFKTCQVQVGSSWTDLDDVSDFVWCLERRINSSVHAENFPGVATPRNQRENASEPSGWSASDIRSTWRLNVGVPE